MNTSWARLVMNETTHKSQQSQQSQRRGRLTLYASKLAACAGMHAHQSQEDLDMEFRHARGLSIDAAVVPADYLPPNLAAARTLDRLTPEERERVNAVLAADHQDAIAVVRAIESVGEYASAEVTDVVRTALYTAQGTACEGGVREAVVSEAAAAGVVRDIRTDARFRVCASPWMSVGGVDVFVGGKHDGMEGDCVIEIKTRQRRFLGVPLYERIQTHAYMHIYGVRRATLVESYLGVRREHAIPFDNALWDRVNVATAAFLGPLLLLVE